VKRIIALTEAGKRLGERLATALDDAELWYKPEPFAAKVQQAFQAGDALIMICATGIAVRAIAPVIVNKHEDPPVVVLDETGRYAVPLLSGHEGGANELARQLTQLIGAELVLTTANPYLQPVYCVGMGCERDCDEPEMRDLLENCVSQAGLAMAQLASINSIDIKADEVGLVALSETLGKPFRVYNKQQLQVEDALLSTRSDYVFETVGVYGVAESAALHAAREASGNAPELVLAKQKSRRATCAIARSYPSVEKKI
jgi:cobalt-precorrin 5A hydrolase